MKKLLKLFSMLTVMVISLGLGIFLVLNYFFFSMYRLPAGELITSVDSPTDDYTVRVYVSKHGATVQDAVRGEVIFHDKKDQSKNIYWNIRESDAEVYWIDAHVVSINGIKLDVRKDVYDFRKEPN